MGWRKLRCQVVLRVEGRAYGNADMLLIRRQGPSSTRVDMIGEQTYDGDSDLWELPAVEVQKQEVSRTGRIGRREEIARGVADHFIPLGWKDLDIQEAISEVLLKAFPNLEIPNEPWSLWKVYSEPDFGPMAPIHSAFFTMKVPSSIVASSDSGGIRWINSEQALTQMVDGTPGSSRIGPLAAFALAPSTPGMLLDKLPVGIPALEYPPGVVSIPLASATLHPFKTTNLVVIAPVVTPEAEACNEDMPARLEENGEAICGEALICDPGARKGKAQAQTPLSAIPMWMTGSMRHTEQLADIVACLPRQLLVFLTHHHHDHVEGLGVVERLRPRALLLGHPATLARLKEVAKTLQRVPVEGGATLIIGKEHASVVAAPGHTDGHLALFHRPTATLVAGDHCVGHGSARLDSQAGGDMQDYLETCERLLKLRARVLIPMHGRPSLWPQQVLNSYIEHRQQREAKILAAICRGAVTAYEVVAAAYQDAPPHFWPAALSNAVLHVRRLEMQQKLPPGYSANKFERSSGLAFHLPVLLQASVWHTLGLLGSRYWLPRNHTMGYTVLAMACLVGIGVLLYPPSM